CPTDGSDTDIVGASRDRTERKRPRRIRDGFHDYAVKSRAIFLLKSHHGTSTGDRLVGEAVYNRSIDRCRCQTYLAGMKNKLEPKLTVSFGDDGFARIEVNIEIFRFSGGDHKLSTCNLTGRNPDAGFCFAREQERLRCIRSAREHHAIRAAATDVVGDDRGVACQHDADLLITSRLQGSSRA